MINQRWKDCFFETGDKVLHAEQYYKSAKAFGDEEMIKESEEFLAETRKDWSLVLVHNSRFKLMDDRDKIAEMQLEIMKTIKEN